MKHPRIVTLSEIHDELQGLLKRQDLFPIIGSGFTKGCQTKRKETVPSGVDMKNYMKTYLLEHGRPAPPDNTFSKIARYYEAIVDKKDFCNYLRSHFVDIELSPECQGFLQINWRFIYTLNLDDAIEKNSPYSYVILPNREFNSEYLEDEKCVFKLHGDANEFIKYGNEKDSILSLTKYIESLDSNKPLLDKLSTDLGFSNAIFIGCSLSDELDLLSVARHLRNDNAVKKSRYFVTGQRPDEYQMIDLNDYGIDTVIVVDSYASFYKEFVELAKTSYLIIEDELEAFHNLKCVAANASDNIDYLICGKFLHDKASNKVLLPSFFIERSIEKQLLTDMAHKRIQIIHGARVSGKSFLLVGLLQKTRNRDTYYFDSRSQVDAHLLNQLSSKQHCVLFFDTNTLTTEALKALLETGCQELERNDTNIVLCVNNSDRDMLEIISDKGTSEVSIATYELRNRFIAGSDGKENELEIINAKLKQNMLIPFVSGQTILDNLLEMQITLRANKPTRFDPPLKLQPNDIGKLCLLILLAQNEKVKASELVQCGLLRESASLLEELKVTVEEDHRSLLFLSSFDSVSYQIVCNAKVWLLNQLRDIGRNTLLEQTIVDAFKRLVRDFLGGTRKFKRIERIVKFDKLNEIFPDGKRLIIKIYDGLRPLLSESYQYFHQFAKCHLWGITSSSYSKDDLEAARIAAITAKRMIEEEMLSFSTYHHSMAHAHILNTLAIAYTKLCIIEKYSDPNLIDETIYYLYEAIRRPENHDAMLQAKYSSPNNTIRAWITHISTSSIQVTNTDKLNKIITAWMSLRN